MKKDTSQNFTLPNEFPSIEDAEVISCRNYPAINAGEVEDWKNQVKHWEHLEFSEKARTRSYITLIILLLWGAWIITGLVRFIITGDFSVLITSPALLSIPLYQILKYYYTRR